MKILHLSQNYYPAFGGGIRYKKSFSEICRKKGFTVINLYNSKTKKVKHRDDIPSETTFLNRSITFSFEGIINFFKLVKNVDFIHLNYPSPQYDLLVIIASILYKRIPLLTIFYHADINKNVRFSRIWNKFFLTFILKKSKYIFVSNTNIKKF